MTLFIRLFLDEDVNALAAKLIRSHGFEVVSALDQGRLGMSDAEQLQYAVANGLCLFTHNRSDFVALAEHYFATERLHFGIIIASQNRPHDIVRRLLLILNKVTADEMQNQVFYI